MKILVLLSRFPYPLEKGDKLRAYHQIRYLGRNNEIYLCALTQKKPLPEHLEMLKPHCKSIHVFRISKWSVLINLIRAFFSGKPFQVGYFYNRHVHAKIRSVARSVQPEHVYCQLLRVAEYARDLNIPKTLDYQDVFSKGVERRIKKAPFYLSPVFRSEYKRLLKYEHSAFEWFDHKTIISEPDRELIPDERRNEIRVVENGVDLDFFTPVVLSKEYDLVFIGNMGYPPNIDAAEFLAGKILPEVHRTRPETTLTLAGANPHSRVKALQSEKVTVTGWVDDIRESYAKARIFIAPMRIGTGLQNKLLEAMAMRIPCITTHLAHSALNAEPGREILVAGSAGEMAEQILSLLSDKQLSERIASEGRKFVRSKYSWEKATLKLLDLMQTAGK